MTAYGENRNPCSVRLSPRGKDEPEAKERLFDRRRHARHQIARGIERVHPGAGDRPHGSERAKSSPTGICDAWLTPDERQSVTREVSAAAAAAPPSSAMNSRRF